MDADVFWHVENYRRAVSAYVRSREDRPFGGVICLREVRCRKALLKTADGGQHILLQDGGSATHVRCVGEDIRVNPLAIEVVIDRFPDVESQQRSIRRLANLYRNRRVGKRQGGWTVEALRHRDALVALDLRMEGRSYREIALFLHGEAAVREDWTNPHQTMKNRVVRSVKRGLRMMNGGYRALLT